MAIGKVNAYATIQAPNVDFGEVALNAQKFQEADLERQKELKLAQLKVEKPKPVDVPETGNFLPGGYNISDVTLSQSLQSVKEDLANIKTEADKLGGIQFLPADVQLRFKNGNKAAETYSKQAEMTATNLKEFLENQSKASGVNDGLYKVIAKTIDNPNDVEHSFENGTWVHRIPQIETLEDGTRKLAVDDKGNKIYKSWYNSDGNVVSSFTQGDLQTKAAFRVIPKVDVVKNVNDIQNTIKATIGQTDTGIVKVKNLYYTDSRVKQAVDNSVENAVSDRATRINLLYDVYSEYKNSKDLSQEELANIIRYSHPMREEDYTEKDMEVARRKFKNMLEGGFGGEVITDVNLAEKRAQDDKDMNKYVLSLVPDTILDKVSPDVIKDGFVVIKDARPTSQSGFGVADINTGKRVRIETGSTLTGITKGKNGIAVIRVAVPVNKSSTYGKSGINFTYNPNLSKEENDLELQRVTQGMTTEEKYYYASDAVVNSLLKGNSSVKSYKQIKAIVSDKNWKPNSQNTNKVQSR
jgi:hypothetical protein